MTPEARSILVPLIRSVREQNQDWWDELKEDTRHNGAAVLYGQSAAAHHLEAAMQDAIRTLPATVRRQLVGLWPSQRSAIQSESDAAILAAYAQLMTADLVSRAAAAVTRYS